MKQYISLLLLSAASLLIGGCRDRVPVRKDFDLAREQTLRMLADMRDPTHIPRTVNRDGTVRWMGIDDWTSGFFAGTLWQLYEYTKDPKWRMEAEKCTWVLEPTRHLTKFHDIGFMINASFGNGYRLTGDPHYREIIADAARTLAQRFRPQIGMIQAWDANVFPDTKCPAVIESMMNIELLFEGFRINGDQHLYDIAVSHADHTIRNHIRPDYSVYSIVDYDPESWKIIRKIASKGYSDESTWSRGQAWGLYGFTMCYRETGQERYLKTALGMADFMIDHPNTPEDLVFYWDFDAPKIPNEPRDVSAAAVTASALLELSKLAPEGNRYYAVAERILQSLSGENYLSKPGTNGNFILTQSVGSAPANSEVSVPLNYADYYFLEALNRYHSYKTARPDKPAL